MRSLVYRDAQVSETKVVGASETIVGDMRQEAVMSRAVEGVSLVYHICPNMSPYELEIGRHLISAAVPAGVDRIVYHSVLHPQIEAMPHHWAKLRVEEALFESEVGYTILQPAAYMRIPVKSSTESGPCRPVAERSDAGWVIINQLDGMRAAARVFRCDSPSKFSR